VSFPSEFPKQAVGVIISAVRGETKNYSQIALAAYEIEGYVLYQVFGDTKYMVGINLPKVDWEKLFALLQDPDLLKYADAIKDAAALFAAGMSPWRIALRITLTYGPAAVSFLRKVLDVIVKE